MDRKTELLRIFQECKAMHQEVDAEKREIENNLELSEKGREIRTNEVQEKFAENIKKYRERALELLNGVAPDSNEKRFTSAEYQMSLSNIFKMLELGAIQTTQDFEEILNICSGDYAAISTIKKLVLLHPNEKAQDFLTMIPEDNREYQNRLLSRLSENVKKYINEDALMMKDLGGFEESRLIAFDSMTQFVQERLDSKLRLIG